MSLTIAAVPSDSHGETNMVYVHTSASLPTSYMRIGRYVYRVQKDAVVGPADVCLNFVQRKACGVSTNGDTINIAQATKDLPAPDVVALMLKLDVEHFSSSKKGGIIDYARFVEFCKAQFENQFLAEGQALLIVLDGNKYIATVREPQFIKASLDVADPASPAPAPGAAAAAAAATAGTHADPAAGPAPAYGLMTKGTTVRVHVLEKSQMQLINIPAKQADMDRGAVVKDFNLEKLGIGGLKKEFGQVFRRAFASRIFPQSVVKKLGIRHVKGVLLYGPPGTGKTLIARKIGEILNCAEPKIVNGPEIFTKWVGGAEENIRKLFADAEAEQAAKGDMSQLHLIIFDEFDAICKTRGSTGDNTGAADNVVNQLLSKIDGVNSLNNVLLIGMTNRKDRIDDAVLRPGRFEVHVEIGLADEAGRQEILKIHTKGMVDSKVLGPDVNLADLAHNTKNFSGAELEGLVRAAQSHAFTRHIDFDNPTKVTSADSIFIGMHDFQEALKDVKPAFGQATDECKNVQRHGIIDYGSTWQALKRRMTDMVRQLQTSHLSTMQLLIHGEVGSGKSSLAGFTALASEFPYVKFITAAPMVGYAELHKCNILRKAFEDSYKSPLSVVVLDDMERLIELSQGGARYSNTLLQTLLVLIKAQPPEGKKLLVIGTTSLRNVLESLEITQCFSAQIEAPLLAPSCLALVSRGLSAQWHTSNEEQLAEKALPEAGIPICRMILLIEMATGAAADKGEDDAPRRVVTFERFSDALLQLGMA